MKMSVHSKIKHPPLTRGEAWLARKVRQFNQYAIDIDPSHEPLLPRLLPPHEKMVYYKFKLRVAFIEEGYRSDNMKDAYFGFSLARDMANSYINEPLYRRKMMARENYRKKRHENNKDNRSDNRNS